MSAAAGVRAEPLSETRRSEERDRVVRHVEYAAFPRVTAAQHIRAGFTRDVSPSGMCLRSESSERVGALLRIIVHGADGRPTRESIARVAWSSSTADGAWWLGLSLVEDRA